MPGLSLTSLESEVLELLLRGEEQVLLALREQLSKAGLRSREMTGYGFYLNFSVPSDTVKLHEKFNVKPDFCFGDVGATMTPLQNGAGFLLWIRDGMLDTLEGYTYDESWPTEVLDFEAHYTAPLARDWEYLRSQWEKT